MEMGAFTGALVALLAKDMANAMASEVGKDVSEAAKQALRRLGQRLRRVSQIPVQRWSSWRPIPAIPSHSSGWPSSSPAS